MEEKASCWEQIPEHSVHEQIQYLSPSERKSFEELKERWIRKSQKIIELDDFKLLRFIRTSPGKRKFDVDEAWKVLEEYEQLSVAYPEALVSFSIKSVQAQMLKGVMLPLPDFCLTSSGHQILYLQISKFFPGKDSLHDLISCLLYLHEWMTRREKTCAEGIYVIYDLKGFSWQNFSLPMMRSVISISQGRFPCRIREIFIVNPPLIFGLAFILTRPSIPEELRNKIHIIRRNETLPSILFGEYSSQRACYLPREIGGALDVDATLREFIRYREDAEPLAFN